MRVLTKSLRKIALGAAVAALSISAQAATYVFDTGTPGTSDGSNLYNYYDNLLKGIRYQGIATAFSLGDATISTVEAYLGMLSSPADVTFELRQGNGDWNGDVVAKGDVSVDPTAGWYGLSGLNKAVTAGTYTLFLLPGDGADGFAYTPATSDPDALSDGWYFYSPSGDLISDNGQYGIRVGEASPVPAPLPILGAVAAIGWSRKLRRRIRDAQALAA